MMAMRITTRMARTTTAGTRVLPEELSLEVVDLDPAAGKDRNIS